MDLNLRPEKGERMALGRNQLGCLKALKEKGPYPGRWVWTTHSQTVIILNSLVNRGLARKYDVPSDRRFGMTDGYEITPNGEALLSMEPSISKPKRMTEEEVRRDERRKEAQRLLQIHKEAGPTLKPGLWYAATLLDPSVEEY